MRAVIVSVQKSPKSSYYTIRVGGNVERGFMVRFEAMKRLYDILGNFTKSSACKTNAALRVDKELNRTLSVEIVVDVG